MKTNLFLFGILVCLLLPSFQIEAQTTKEIRKKEQELQRLRNEIHLYEKKIVDSQKKERVTLDLLDNIEHQINLIRRLIRQLMKDEESLSAQIVQSKQTIDYLETQLEARKTHYARYVSTVYKHGRIYDFELLFSSNSINQLYIRLEYLKRFSEQRARDLKNITEKKSVIERTSKELEANLIEQHRLLAEKTNEEVTLKNKAIRRQKTLKSLRNDKRLYQTELTRRHDAMKRVEQLIAELIEKERLRKEREAAEAKARAEALARERAAAKKPIVVPPAADVVATSHFELKRGKLRWPVQQGAITSRFGTHTHPVLHTVTENPGIEISAPTGSDVYAVASGEVSLISFIPGFGNILILSHGNGFRTVYAHLSDIIVRENQSISEGEVIAKSGDSVSGSILHFQIWKEKEKQNPEVWLAHRK
jgi:septal ring factor EnvC (AmiA/AmiB activator)